jgi:hypothetical protein
MLMADRNTVPVPVSAAMVRSELLVATPPPKFPTYLGSTIQLKAEPMARKPKNTRASSGNKYLFTSCRGSSEEYENREEVRFRSVSSQPKPQRLPEDPAGWRRTFLLRLPSYRSLN